MAVKFIKRGKLVRTREEVIANIKTYQDVLDKSSEIQRRLGYVPAWYAIRRVDGQWLFGPSKFVGYENNTASRYLASADAGADGRETEHALKDLAASLDLSTRIGRDAFSALESFLKKFDRKPNKRARINIVLDEARPQRPAIAPEHESLLLGNIIADPKICGGRPTIKGTRMRVSDIIDMLAQGVTHKEILADFPYLRNEDILAALAYAARAADHRIIHVA